MTRAERTLDADEVRAFLDAARGDRLEALFVLAVSTGMRRGELLGLKWRDLDAGTGKPSVRRSLVITKKDGVGFRNTKRKKSRRSIELSRRTQEALVGYRASQNEERLALDAEWQNSGLIFPGERGQPMKPYALTGGSFRRTLGRAGLPEGVTFHGATRHTCATLLLSKGVHPKLVQELLGHATISITLDTYSHVLPGMDDGLADTMDAAIS